MSTFDSLFGTEILVRSTLLVLLMLAVYFGARRSSAAFRHWLLALGFLGLLLLPALMMSELSVGIPLIARTNTVMHQMKAEASLDDSPQSIPRSPSPMTADREAPRQTDPKQQVAAAVADAPAPPPSQNGWPGVSLAAMLLAVWVLGAAISAASLVRELYLARHLRQEALVVDEPTWQRLSQIAASQLGLQDRPSLRRSPESVPPFVCGIWRPVVILPASASSWSPELRQAVLLHEFSHIKRHDLLWQLMARITCVFYWFQPLAWYALGRLRLERELACDDRVLACGESATSYATQLVQVARQVQGRRLRAAVAMASPSVLEARIQALLDRTRTHLGLRTVEAWGVVAIVTSLTTAIAALELDEQVALANPAGALQAQDQQALSVPATDRLDQFGDPLPEGAVSRLGTIHFRQPDDIEDVQFTGDGDLAVTAAQGGTVTFFERATGRMIERVKPARPGSYNAQHIERLSDGRLAVAGSFLAADDQNHVGVVRFFNPKNRREDGRFQLSRPSESVLAVSKNGSLILSGTRETVRVLDRETGGELSHHEFPRQEVSQATFSPDGVQLALGSNSAIYLWKWLGDNPPIKVADTRGTLSLAFSTLGDRLVVATDDHPSRGVRVFDVASGGELIELPLTAGREYAREVSFLANDQQVVAGSDPAKAVTIWDLAKGQEIRRLSTAPGDPGSVAISQDSKWAISHSFWRAVLRAWNLETGEELGSGSAPPLGYALQLAFSHDGKTLYTGAEDQTLRAWEVETGRQLYRMDHGHWVRGLALSPDGRWIATSSLDDTVCIRDASTGRTLYQLPGHGKMGGKRAVRFSPDSERLASFGDDMFVRVWNVADGRALSEALVRPSGVEIPEDPGDDGGADFDNWRFGVDAALFSLDISRLVMSYRSRVREFDVATGKEQSAFDHADGGLHGLAVSPNGQLFATSSWGRSVDIPLPDGRVRSSAARNHAIRLRSFADGKELWSLALPDGGSGPIAFSADGTRLVTAAGQPAHRIQVWEASSGRELARIPMPEHRAWAVALSPDGRRVAASLNDTTIVIWDVDSFLVTPASKGTP